MCTVIVRFFFFFFFFEGGGGDFELNFWVQLFDANDVVS